MAERPRSEPLDAQIRAAVANAVRTLPFGPCEVCGATPARAYGFACAFRSGYVSKDSGVTEPVPDTPYGPMQGRAANLCEVCVLKYWRDQRKRIAYAVLGLSATGLLCLAGAAALVADGSHDLGLALLPALLGVVLMALYPAWWLRQGRHPKNWRTAGAELALSLHRAQLEHDGFFCWLTEEDTSSAGQVTSG